MAKRVTKAVELDEDVAVKQVEIPVAANTVVRGDDNNWTWLWALYQQHKAKIWGLVWTVVGLLVGSNVLDDTVNDVFPSFKKLGDRVTVVERDVEQLKATVFEEVTEESGEESEE